MYGQTTTPAPKPAAPQIGQPINMQPRQATEAEALLWSNFLQLYRNRTTPDIRAYLDTANVAATWQAWFDSRQIPIVCFDVEAQARVDGILERYNTIGRLITGAELNKYVLYFNPQTGDISACAPVGMTSDEYAPDMYPGALGVLWFPIILGIILIGGFITADSALDYAAKKSDNDLQLAILKADQDMAKQPEAVRKAYSDFKTQSKAAVDAANKSHGKGWLDDLFGEGGILGGSGIGLAIGAAVLIFALSAAGGARRVIGEAPAPAPALPATVENARRRKSARRARQNPYPGGMCMSAAGGGGWQGKVKWSHDTEKRGRQAQHIADYYDARHWGSYADYLHDKHGAQEIEITGPGTY